MKQKPDAVSVWLLFFQNRHSEIKLEPAEI